MADLTVLTQEALAAVAACGDLAVLDEVRVHWLGKKGLITEQLKALGALPAAEIFIGRPRVRRQPALELAQVSPEGCQQGMAHRAVAGVVAPGDRAVHVGPAGWGL